MVFRPELDAAREEPLYRQLFTYVSRAITSGELEIGERLPATRELAGLLGVNRTTVSAAYDLLETAGLISGQVGRGSFVAARLAARLPDWDELLGSHEAWTPRFATGAPISFAASRPPADGFPLEAFRASTREVLESDQLLTILQLGTAAGYEPLRRYLIDDARGKGVLGGDDDLLITNGCQQALELLTHVLLRPGSGVAVEDPVYSGLKNILRAAKAELAAVPFDGERFAWEDVMREGAPTRPVAAVVTPNYQNPTGVSLSLSERESIVVGARRNGVILIENDIYSELRYQGEALPPLKQISPDGATVLLRSFSKVAFPGLRIGWVIGPRRLVAAMRERKQLTDLHSDQFSQAVMLRFAESGRLRTHVDNMVAAGRVRLQAALESIEQFFPEGTRWTSPHGGLNLWITLPDRLDAGAMLDRARREGVAYLPGLVFGVAKDWRSSLRLSFGGSPLPEIRQGLETLGRVFTEEQAAWRQAEKEPAAALV